MCEVIISIQSPKFRHLKISCQHLIKALIWHHCLWSTSLQEAQRDGEWGLPSVHHTSSLPLLPPQGVDSSHSPCFSMGFLPWDTVLHKLLPHEFFPQTTVLLKLLQKWVPSTGNSPSGTDCSCAGPPWIHRSYQEPSSVWAFHTVTTSFGHPLALAWGPPLAAGGYLLHH